MAEVGLTAGGFYSHFRSKDALLAEAFAFAAAQSLEDRDTVDENGEPSAVAFVDSYLSDNHRDGMSTGCPIAAIAPEVSRASPVVRRKAASEIANLLTELERSTNINARNSAPILALSVGALILARLVGKADSDRVLADCRRAARVIAEQP
jgi:TetR/AcrR family transcriptional regulator, transcriptional repressor for nem operon